MPRHKLRNCPKLPATAVRLIPIQPKIASTSPMLTEDDVVNTVSQFLDINGKKVKDEILDARALPREVFLSAENGIICTIERSICLVASPDGMRIQTLGRYFKKGHLIALPTVDCASQVREMQIDRSVARLLA